MTRDWIQPRDSQIEVIVPRSLIGWIETIHGQHRLFSIQRHARIADEVSLKKVMKAIRLRFEKMGAPFLVPVDINPMESSKG